MTPGKAGIKDLRGQDLTHGFIPRTTFVIDKKGKIIAVFSSATDKISPAEHVEKSLAIVQSQTAHSWQKQTNCSYTQAIAQM